MGEHLVLRHRISQNRIPNSLAQEAKMKVGDLVRARHWHNGEIAILLSFRKNWGICRVAIGDYIFEQLVSDLEVICK